MGEAAKRVSERVLILGCGGHARVIWDILEQMDTAVVGFTAPDVPPGTPIKIGPWSRPVLGDDDILEARLRDDRHLKLFSGVGPEPADVRRRVIERVRGFGRDRMVVACHPSAVVSAAAVIGADTAVMAGAVVNAGAVIGSHVVINTGTTIDHECQIGENVFIGPGAHLAGRVVIEDDAIIGIGAAIKENIHVGRGAFVGGGAFVNRDVRAQAVVVGVPARFLRERDI